MEHLSARVAGMSESATIAMAQLSRELKAQGKDIISLSLGEPDFNTPDFIKDAAIEAINNNLTNYPPVPGYLDVREAISRKFKRDNNLNYSASEIVISTGAKQSLINVILSLVNPGEEILLPAPYWVSYEAMAHMADAEVKALPTSIESDFKVTPEQLEAAIGKNTRLMIFSTPCNPSGTVYTKDELQALAKVIAKHPNFYVICDEIYELINFTGHHESLAQFEEVYNQVVTVNGVSKGFSMTGWRLGYIGAPEWIAKAATKIQGQFTSGASTISQMAAKAAVEAAPSSINYMLQAFEERRDLVAEKIHEIPGFKSNIPQGAFYIFPDVSELFGKTTPHGDVLQTASDLCMYLLNEAEVALVPGEAFGSPNCLRISYAASKETLIEALNRIHKAVDKLN
jgi:aspartate aminotransferase